jgi:hypothetical protein
MSDTAYVTALPECDFCQLAGVNEPATYDGATVEGPWVDRTIGLDNVRQRLPRRGRCALARLRSGRRRYRGCQRTRARSLRWNAGDLTQPRGHHRRPRPGGVPVTGWVLTHCVFLFAYGDAILTAPKALPTPVCWVPGDGPRLGPQWSHSVWAAAVTPVIFWIRRRFT